MTHDAAMKNTDFLKLAEEACRGIRDFPLSDKDCKMLDWLREEMFEAGLFKQNDRGTFVLQGDYAFPSVLAATYIFTGDRATDPEHVWKDNQGVTLAERRRPI
jgi:hypothetical protein